VSISLRGGAIPIFGNEMGVRGEGVESTTSTTAPFAERKNAKDAAPSKAKHSLRLVRKGDPPAKKPQLRALVAIFGCDREQYEKLGENSAERKNSPGVSGAPCLRVGLASGAPTALDTLRAANQVRNPDWQQLFGLFPDLTSVSAWGNCRNQGCS
jgi:hypothetical protein